MKYFLVKSTIANQGVLLQCKGNVVAVILYEAGKTCINHSPPYLVLLF